jgi:NhaP-type Na+/H+ or K+/H+ antiporter
MDRIASFNLILFLCMATVLGLALVSKALSNRFIGSEPIVAVAAGAIFGPYVLDWVRVGDLTGYQPVLLEQLARLTLAIAIVTAALRVGWPWVRRHWRDVGLILLIGLPLMWGFSIAALSVTLSLPVLTLVLLAAIMTPTDPVLAQAITTSETAEEKVPEDVRHLISADSAGNDGLAFLFVTVAVWLVGTGKTRGWADLAYLIGWEVLAALAVGAAFGWIMGKLMVSAAGSWGSELSLVSATTALAFATVTGLKLLDMDGLFGVFGAGLALSAAIGEEHHARPIGFNHALAEIFQLPLLVLFGMTLPFDEWYRMGWPLLFAVILVLLIRRIPMLLALKPWLRAVPDWPSALFVGWFGPIGIGTLFYAAVALRETDAASLYPVATAIIAGSVLAHGVTDTPGSGLLAWLRGEKPGRRKAAKEEGDDRTQA